MSTLEKDKTVIESRKKSPPAAEDRARETLVRQSREQYKSFLDSINRSTDHDIDRALRRA